MPIQNYLLENAGKAVLRGEVITTPEYMYWAGSDNTYTGSETLIVNDFFHKGVYWVSDGIDSKFSVELGTTDCVGSYINTYGIIDNATVGSGIPSMLLPSDIGVKSSNFSVEIEGRIIFRRP